MNLVLFRYLILLSTSFWFDRWTKKFALQAFSGQQAYVNPFVNFSLQWNRGVSFSWFTPETTVGFIALTAAVIAIIFLFALYTYAQFRQGKHLYAEMLVLAGACSNLYDRFQYGAVVDFIDFHIGSWHFATFNVADMCICLGMAWLMIVQVKEGYEAYVKKNS